MKPETRSWLLVGVVLSALALFASMFMTRVLPPPHEVAVAQLQLRLGAQPNGSKEGSATLSRPTTDFEFVDGASDACWGPAKARIEQGLAKDLSADFPELRAIFSKSEVSDPNQPRNLLFKLLDTAKSAPQDQKPTLLLAADRVAYRLPLPYENPPSPELKNVLDRLASYGLTFRWSEMGGNYEYWSDLLSQLWRDYPGTSAGEDAFVLLMERGFDTSPCCQNGANEFREVIRRGEEFLSQHPQSRHRADVEYELGQAYETWWSLSQPIDPAEEQDRPDPAAYREGADPALAKAIMRYEDVVGAAPNTGEAKCAETVLPQLKEKIDTKQRRYLCECD